jgi:iron complex outermembrane receptor protein
MRIDHTHCPNLWRGGGLALSLAGTLLGSVALAPSRAAAADAAVNPDSAATGGDVVVTARKRAERLIDVPAPVSAISGQTLKQLSAVKFTDYLTSVPGVNFDSGREGSTLLILRGIATGAANPTVATYIDEAPFGSSTIFASGSALTPDIDPGDIEQIELLRGPQGTLYGANAIGGILKFVTTPPDTARFGGRLEASAESISGGGVGGGLRGSLNIPVVSDTLAIRVSGYGRDDPGFIDDVLHNQQNINDTQVYGGRIDLLWKPTPDLKVRLSAMAHNLTSPNSNGMDVQQIRACPTCNHGVIDGPTYGDLEVKRYLPQPLDIHYGIYNATLTWTPGPVSLVSSTSYATERVDIVSDYTAQYGPLLHGAIPSLFPSNLGVTLSRNISQTKITQEVRLASAGDTKLDWQVGVFATQERSSSDDPIHLYTYPSGAPYVVPVAAYQNVFHATLYSQYTEVSVFGDVDYHFTPKLDLTLGGRYSYDAQTYSQPSSGILYGPAADPGGSGTESAFTFLVNPRYKLSADSVLYVRIASGYRPGGPNAVPPAALNFPATFGPDFLTSYEAGWKAELFDHRVSVDASAFYLQWSKMQLPTVIGGYSAEANGGAAHSAGFESQVTWTPIRGLTLEGDATYTDAVMDSSNPTAGAFKGNHLPLVPLWNWGASADYGWTMANNWDGFVGISYRNIGKRPNVFLANTATTGYYVPFPGYYTLDLRAGVTRDRWTLEVFVRNVTDQRGVTATNANTGVAEAADASVAIIQPRTVGASLAVKF